MNIEKTKAQMRKGVLELCVFALLKKKDYYGYELVHEISKNIGSFAVVVAPLDEDAENFYYKYGFVKLPDSGKMFLPMNMIKQLFE